MAAGLRHTEASTRFAAVIVNYNGAGTLLGAVRSALREGVEEAQIVVVDNGSVDVSLAEVQAVAPDVVMLRNECNAGFARAVNRGLRFVDTEFALLLNNDAELNPGALAAFAEAFDRHVHLAIAGGQLRYPEGQLQSAFSPLPTLVEEIVPLNFLKWMRPARYKRSSDTGETRMVESVFGACLAVRVAALPSIGLLDEDFFFYFEEVDWCRRAHLRGWSVAYVPDATAIHLLGHTANRFRNEARVELQRSKLLYFRKSGSWGGYLLLSSFLVLRTGINALFGVLWCVATLFLHAKIRKNTRAYLYLFAWHLLGRPVSWGLPGKCQ